MAQNYEIVIERQRGPMVLELLKRGVDKLDLLRYDLKSAIRITYNKYTPLIVREEGYGTPYGAICYGRLPWDERFYLYAGCNTAEEKRSYTRILKQEDKLVGVIEELRQKSEDMLKGLLATGVKVKSNGELEMHGRFTAEFLVRGETLQQDRGTYAFARLQYKTSDSSCNVVISPAVIPGPAPSTRSDAKTEKKMKDWQNLFGDILRKSGMTPIRIGFGDPSGIDMWLSARNLKEWQSSFNGGTLISRCPKQITT